MRSMVPLCGAHTPRDGPGRQRAPTIVYESLTRESGGPAAARLYTRARIAAIYAAHREGAYIGREAEWTRQEVDRSRFDARDSKSDRQIIHSF